MRKNSKITWEFCFIQYAIVCLLSLKLFVFLFFALASHEIAHVLAGKLVKVRAKRITIGMFYGSVEFEKDIFMMTPIEKFIISIAGPAINILSGIALAYIDAKYALVLIVIGLANLIPILPTDGAQIVSACIDMFTKNKYVSYSITSIIGMVIGLYVTYVFDMIYDPFWCVFMAYFYAMNISWLFYGKQILEEKYDETISRRNC
jgi:Zn-dependent protease